MLNSTNDYIYSSNGFDFISEKENITDFGLGIGLGGKWITNSGFIGELNVGFGRNLFNTDRYDYEIIGKIGINVGYRF